MMTAPALVRNDEAHCPGRENYNAVVSARDLADSCESATALPSLAGCSTVLVDAFHQCLSSLTNPLPSAIEDLPAFQACVERGKSAGLMCSYSACELNTLHRLMRTCARLCLMLAGDRADAVNGYPTCAWPWLLNETARHAWSFDGCAWPTTEPLRFDCCLPVVCADITGDCGAARDVCSKCQDCLCPGGHHFQNATPPEVVRDVLTAGMDNDCGQPMFRPHAVLCPYQYVSTPPRMMLPRQPDNSSRPSKTKVGPVSIDRRWKRPLLLPRL